MNTFLSHLLTFLVLGVIGYVVHLLVDSLGFVFLKGYGPGSVLVVYDRLHEKVLYFLDNVFPLTKVADRSPLDIYRPTVSLGLAGGTTVAGAWMIFGLIMFFIHWFVIDVLCPPETLSSFLKHQQIKEETAKKFMEMGATIMAMIVKECVVTTTIGFFISYNIAKKARIKPHVGAMIAWIVGCSWLLIMQLYIYFAEIPVKGGWRPGLLLC